MYLKSERREKKYLIEALVREKPEFRGDSTSLNRERNLKVLEANLACGNPLRKWGRGWGNKQEVTQWGV